MGLKTQSAPVGPKSPKDTDFAENWLHGWLPLQSNVSQIEATLLSTRKTFLWSGYPWYLRSQVAPHEIAS